MGPGLCCGTRSPAQSESPSVTHTAPTASASSSSLPRRRSPVEHTGCQNRSLLPRPAADPTAAAQHAFCSEHGQRLGKPAASGPEWPHTPPDRSEFISYDQKLRYSLMSSAMALCVLRSSFSSFFATSRFRSLGNRTCYFVDPRVVN